MLSVTLPMSRLLRPVDSLSSLEAKSIAEHALKLHRTMTRPGSPSKLLLVSLPQNRQVTWIRLIGAKWLLVASSDSSSSALTLFSASGILLGEGPSPLAQAYLDAAVTHGELEVLQDGSVICALELSSATYV